VLADVAETHRSALPAVHLEAQADSHRSALLGRGASVSEGPGEPLELWLILVLADLPVTSCSVARLEEILAPAAHEDTGVEIIAPLMLTRLLSRMPLPLPASGG
jgi:hypothetical protein